MKVGEVYYLRADNSYGYEEAIGRPVLVFAGDEKQMMNDDNPGMVIVAYMSTSPKNIGINILVNSTNRRSWVLCNQIKAIDGRRLRDKMCDLNPTELEDVRDGLRQALGLTVSVKDGSDLVEENLNLKLELEIAKKMYDRVLGLLVDERINVDVKSRKPEPEPIQEPTQEPIEVDVKLLEHQMSTPNVLMSDEDSPIEFKAKKRNPQYETIAASRLKERMDAAKRKMIGKKANINTATAEELMGAAGMGIGMARIIVKRRRDFGPYKDVSDLLNIHQLSDKMFVKYEPFLEV